MPHKLKAKVTGSKFVSYQRAKKVQSDSPGLEHLATGLVNFVLSLPDGQVKFFENSNYRRAL